MRPSWLGWSLFSLLAVPALASVDISSSSDGMRLFKRGWSSEPSGPTKFNGLEVPPIREITPDNFEELTKDGYWIIEHFSPSCPHCKRIAPAYQTLYEFYYTSNPLSSSSTKSLDTKSLNSFTGYYDIRFGRMNCQAYADQCEKLGIEFYPTFAFYHNGDQLDKYVGPKNMADISTFVEGKLDLIKPGSRPLNGVELPAVGATSMDPLSDPTEDPDQYYVNDKYPQAGTKDTEKHNEQDSQKAAADLDLDAGKAGTGSSTPPKSVVPKPKGPPPNPQGISVALTAESFQKLVTTTQDPWFIKFYAPWCPHCQAMNPNWQQMAREMKDTLNIGEVDCTVERRLCSDARVSAYPTMYFFRGGERVEYTGLRGLGDLLSYSKNAVAVQHGIQDVDATSFKELEETEEVLFLYFYDHATTSEDLRAMERLTLSLVGHARIVKTSDSSLAERFKIHTWPRLLVVRDGRPNYYNALAPKDMRDFRQVLSWMQTVWLPIVPELTASNAQEIMDGKFVVLGILSRRRSDDFTQSRRELKEAALEWMDKQVQLFQLERSELRDSKQLRIEEAEDRNDQRALRSAKQQRITIREDDKKAVAFAWVDGDFWERWLRTTYGIDVENGDRVIINDEDNRRYWDTASSGATIMASRTSILETIPLVIASPPKLSPKSTVGTFETIFFLTRSSLGSSRLLFFVVVVVVLAVAVLFGRGRLLRRAGFGRGGILGNPNGGFFHLDGKEGLLNGGSTDKVD
ncbi:hypothetical protein N7474_010922 [Penicillium riverlandense]|uniref:uncharacterized protein n=1 Tax=Penicillium riverlandense TaxID=1903569 RepID=UPI0025485D71|nr:uncharacterized protein N7474_010922 [Penicillium riverlandense]KAJ5805035.1 hypothetical protein N7474_010922 [Penicillium riverlandense]